MAVIGRLSAILGLHSAGFHSGLRKAGMEVQDFRAKVTGSNASIVGLGGNIQRFTAMVMRATMAIGALYIAFGAFRPADAFAQSMAKSTAIMGDLSTEMRQQMEGVAKEVATNTRFDLNEAADAYFYLASAGMDAAQSMRALPQVAAFAQAGSFDIATATTLAADAQSALGMTSANAQKNLEGLARVTDVLTAANTKANANIQQFSEALTNKFGAGLRVVGKGIEEGVAVLAAFARQGVKGTEAGTQAAIVLRDLQTKAIQNKSAFEQFGVSVYTSAGKMRNMADIVADIEQAFKGMSDEMKKATLLQLGFTDKSVNAILNLVGMSDFMRKVEGDMQGVSGITQEIAGKNFPEFNEQVHRAWMLLKRISVSLFGPVLLLLAQLLRIVNPLLEWTALTLEKVADAAGIFGLGLEAGAKQAGLLSDGTDKLGEASDKVTPKLGSLAEQSKELNNICGETAVTAAEAAKGIDKLRESLERELESGGRNDLLTKLFALKAAGDFGTGNGFDADKYRSIHDMLQRVLNLRMRLDRMSEMEQLKSQGRQLAESLETPMEKFKRRVAEANNLVYQGAIGWRTYQREINAAREEFIRLKSDMQGPGLVKRGTQAEFETLNQWKARQAALTAMPDVSMPKFRPDRAVWDSASQEFQALARQSWQDQFLGRGGKEIASQLLMEMNQGTLPDVIPKGIPWNDRQAHEYLSRKRSPWPDDGYREPMIPQRLSPRADDGYREPMIPQRLSPRADDAYREPMVPERRRPWADDGYREPMIPTGRSEKAERNIEKMIEELGVIRVEAEAQTDATNRAADAIEQMDKPQVVEM